MLFGVNCCRPVFYNQGLHNLTKLLFFSQTRLMLIGKFRMEISEIVYLTKINKSTCIAFDNSHFNGNRGDLPEYI